MSDHNSMQDWPTRKYEFTLPVRYHLTAAQGPGVVICMHGYQDHALSMLRRMGWWEAELPFRILAINGPFPVPIWAGDGFKEAYSWYFRDSSKNLVLAPPSMTADRIKILIDDLGLEKTPKILFGFSQGGFFAPYLGAKLKNLKGLITLGCDYPADGYTLCPPTTVQAIHGEKDERIPIAPAHLSFDKVIASGHKGAFHQIPDLTHRVEASLDPLVRQLVGELFK